ncbi:MAG: hypothetical protein LBL80_01695 [Ruminococcus sp.]|jgi:hypothetical protein|nr:hypothetical protein [Ruminococcus sp.]
MKKFFSTQGLGWGVIFFILGAFIIQIIEQIKIGFTSVGKLLLDTYFAFCSIINLNLLIPMAFFVVFLFWSIDKITTIISLERHPDKKDENLQVTVNKNKKQHKILTIISIILLIIVNIISTATFVMPLLHNEYFDYSMKSISPYISNQEVLQLESDWVNMRSYEDYMKIYERLIEVKEQYNLY